MIKVGDILEGKISMNRNGSAYMVSDNLPKDIYIHKKNTNKALHLDTVKIEVFYGDGKLEGEVIEIVNRFKEEFVGTIDMSDTFAFLVPDSNKMPYDIFIPKNKFNGVTDGQKAIARITKWKDGFDKPNGEIIEVLGDAGDNDAEIHAILHEYGLPYDFPEDVLDEANAIDPTISEDDIAKRRDFRDVTTICIDPATARDKDDAISFRTLDGGIIEVGIHIADVSHYLRPNTELDKEAFQRGTSVYLVDRVVPMLPERLSNGVCSLNPNEDKLCFSAVFELHGGTYEIMSEWFGRTVVNVDYDYSYEEAQDFLEGKVIPVEGTFDGAAALVNLHNIATDLRKKRFNHDSISFEKREIKFKLDEENNPTGIEFKVAKDANKLIEEFMLLANKRVGKFINDKKLPCVNRFHDSPDNIRLEELRDLVGDLGYKLDLKTPDTIRKTLNQLLIDIQGKPEEDMVSTLVLRSMQKAIYSSEECGHYGLNFETYSHFTSPIRRYPDVMIHRLLARYLDNKYDIKQTKLEAKCKHLSERERKAQKAERDSIKYMQCLFLMDKIGQTFDAVVSGVKDYGIFVEMLDTKSEGLIKLKDIGGDVWTAEVAKHRLVGYNTNDKICLGDKVYVTIVRVDIERKTIDFKLLR